MPCWKTAEAKKAGFADLKRNQEQSSSVSKRCTVLRLSGENTVAKLCRKVLLIGKVEKDGVPSLLPWRLVKPQIEEHNQDIDLERLLYSLKKIGQLPETSHNIIGSFFCSPGASLCLTVTFPLRQAKKKFKVALHMIPRVEKQYLQS